MNGQLGTSLNLTFPHGVAAGALINFATGMILSSGAALSQGLDVPVVIPPGDGQMADCATSTVSGLDPAGDNFLAVRSGPGTKHRKIDEIHAGDVVYTCDARGDWIGIRYPDENGRSGWVYGRYLTPLAG